ncbi:MAG: outer membrane protein assembly factor BamE [Rickettsiales bacterium]|jgi:outer membrane protein assembly factor BamE (lipoprotein component of BamABCDE complex)|nr:outer membrane protein assembly factor BamE [Rickettsiales bacterium]
MKKLAIIVSLLLSACVTKRYDLGVAIREDQEEAAKNASTKAEVQKILGSPQSMTMIGEEKWFYTTAKGRVFAFSRPYFLEYKILAVRFDADNNVVGVDTRDISDVEFAQAGGATRIDSDLKPGFFEELFGNIGRLNMGGMGLDSTARSSGASTVETE